MVFVLRAAGAALATSLVNLIILIALNGRQLGWVCLASCSTDVSIAFPFPLHYLY